MAEHAKGRMATLLGGNPLLYAVAAIGFSVSFQTIAHAAKAHHLPGYPVLYPLGLDAGILALIVESRHLIRLRKSDAVPRFLAWLLTGVTVYANVHGSPPHDWVGRGLHAVMPCLWVVGLELTRRRMIASEVERRDKIPLARWMLAPLSTFRLWRWMVLWQITSYSLALEREQVRRRAIAALKAEHGGKWRSLADSSVVWQLRHGIDVEGAAAAAIRAAEPAAESAAKPRQSARQNGAAKRGAASGGNRGKRAAWARYESKHPDASPAEVAAAIGAHKRTVERWRGQSVVAEAERAVSE